MDQLKKRIAYATAGLLCLMAASVSHAKATKTTSVTNTTIVREERYAGQYHHIDVGNVVEDYLYLNGERVGVLQNGTQLSFPLADHEGSYVMTTDAQGNSSGYVEYLPYGKQTSGSAQPTSGNDHRFIDKETDVETSLLYFDARYYNNSQARFNSTDPLLFDQSELPRILVDPQQLNGYAYGRNNPISLFDPTGEMVELVRRPVGSNPTVGAHAFVLITNTQGDAAQLMDMPGVTDKTKITLGGYTSERGWLQASVGDLVKHVNNPDDYALPERKYMSRAVIQKPDRYASQTEFENSVLQSYLTLPDNLGAYSFLAHPISARQANSNNVASTILLDAGVSRGQIVSGVSNLEMMKTPGLGTHVPDNRSTSAIRQWNVLKYITQRAFEGLISRFSF